MNNKLHLAFAATMLLAAGCATRFGATSDGQEAHLYTLKSPDGLRLEITDFGGRLVRAWAPDRNGNLADVTLGWNTVDEYERLGFKNGTLVGRFANRIADGKFTLDGKVYQLPVNETTPSPRHCNLHSGPVSWDNYVWTARKFSDGDADCLELTHTSPDGESGFPGNVTAKVTYSVLPGNIWRIDYELTTDKPTVVNPTHHSYWNMAGESSGTVLAQQLKIYADQYTKTDDGLIPTVNAPVKGTPFDFTKPQILATRVRMMAAEESLACTGYWYDHNFVIRGKAGELRPAAELYDPVSGRYLEVWTTEPCMQVYGSQNMTEKLPAKAEGKHLCKYAGLAIETQHYPDSPNRPDFPSTVLRPGEVFRSRTECRFGVR